MKKTPTQFKSAQISVNRGKRIGLLSAICTATLLSACGGGSTDTPISAQPTQVQTPVDALVASATTTLTLDTAALPEDMALQEVQPTFHIAPVLLNEPDDVDAANNSSSARMAPRKQAMPVEFENMSTRNLTVPALQVAEQTRSMRARALAADGTIAPMATGSVVATYSPAQIRAAYGLPALPAAGATLTAAQAAQLGAGQTIYIVDAMHNPNVAAELAAFNQKFGLPTCTTKALPSTTSLPLAKAITTGCELSVAYSTTSGTMSSVAPAYNAGWATEIALDVQWSHATAPLARIVLIEAADASLNGLLGGVKLANAMGSGVVSMSFGGTEGTYTASVDATFTGANMTYLASTGDSGAAVSWPAVSPNVVAVSGTSLTYSGTGTRSEVAWSGTGGGTSLYTPTPSYQTSAVPGMGTLAHRTVADVAFNADPSTGQYVAVLAQGSSTVNWISAGGTSISAPQWAGVVAVANAMRAANSKPALAGPHAVLYGQIAAVPGTYASAFADINKGTNGTCVTCTAKVGYDSVTGLGTPNAASLLSTLSGATVAVAAPTVTPASISGTVGTALSFTVSATAPNPITYTLTGAPAGMAINTNGEVTWATPIAGTYAVTVIAKDSKTALSGQGVYAVTIAAAQPPVVTATTITGKPGTALSFSVAITSANPITYTLGGAPTGMTVSAAGLVSWASPVVGTYTVTVTAKDTKTGLSGQGVYTVKIATVGPVITFAAMSGVVGKPITGTFTITDPGATSLSLSISGVPMGMTFSVSGMTFTANWASPVLGSYNMTVSVVDSAGLTAKAVIPITVNAK